MKKLRDFPKQDQKRIALSYIENGENYKSICAKNDISPSTFYRILRKTMIEHVVDYSAITKFKALSVKHQFEYFGNSIEMRTHISYYTILLKRANYFPSRKKRREIFKAFLIKADCMSTKDLCNAYFIDRELLEKIILDCLVNRIVPKKDFYALKEKLVKKNEANDELFKNLLLIRNVNLKVNVHSLYDFIYDHDKKLDATKFINNNAFWGLI